MQANPFRSLFILSRVPLSLSVTFTAFVAFTVCHGRLDASALLPIIAVFLLAAGSSALNQVLERKTDALMSRTSSRPLPAGEIKPLSALAFSILLMSSGIALFIHLGSWIPLVLGIVNIICYDWIYTSLKMKTSFALLPGAVTGAIPVFMGWTAAGGHILDAELLLIGVFMFFWQVPHFWMLMLMFDKDYKAAGIPSITDHFSLFSVKRIMLIWLLAASVTSVMLVTRGFSHHHVPGILVLILNFILLLLTTHRLFIAKRDAFRFLFILVNCFLFAVFILLAADRLWI